LEDHNINKDFNFLHGGSKVISEIKKTDWATTSPGNPGTWPAELKFALQYIISSKVPMLLVWGNDTIPFYNDAFADSLTSQLAIGKKITDPFIEQVISENEQKIRATGEGISQNDLLIPVYINGNLKDAWWSLNYIPVYDADGSVAGVSVTFQDTTTNNRAEQSLKSVNQSMLLMVLQAPVAICIFKSPDYTIDVINPLMEQMLGREASLLQSRPFFEGMPELQNSGLKEILDDVWATGKSFIAKEQHFRLPRDNKIETVYVDYIYEPMKDPAGKVNGIMVVAIDVTDQVFARIKSEQNESSIRSIIKSAPFPIGVYVGHDMVVEFANKSLLDVWGKDKSVIGKQYAEVMPQLAKQLAIEQLTNVYTTGVPFSAKNQLVQIEKEHGIDTYYLNYSFTPLYDSGGKIYGIMSTAADVTSLNLTKQEAELSQRRFKSLIEEAPVATCLFTGPEMKIEVANPKMLSVWGKGTSVMGKPLIEGLPELKGQEFLSILDEVYRTGIVYSDTDSRADIVVDGVLQTFYFDFTYKPLRNAQGEVYGIMDMAVDVTEKVIAKQKIEQEKKRFHSLIEEAPVATALFTGREMSVEIANEKMLEIWGKDTSIQGKPLIEAVPELIGQPFLDILDTVFTTGTTYENRDTRAELIIDGIKGVYYFDFTYKPIRNENGEVHGIINMVVDVTAKVLSNQRIIESQKQLLDSFEQSPVGISLIKNEGLTFTMANAFYGELVGRKPDEIINKPLLEALPELKGQGFDDLLKGVIATGIPYVAKEVGVELLRNNELEVIYVDLAYQPRRERDGSVSGILVVATDVTEQVRSRKKVEASEARIRSIIASAPAGMGLFVGRDLIVELPNQTFIDIVGKGWDIVGKPLREAMPELLSEGQPFLKILDDVFTTGVMFQSYGAQVKIVQHGVMTYNYYNITYSPLFDENGEVYAILDIAIDVTDAILARQKAEDAGKALLGAIELAELAAWSYNIKENTYTYSQRFMEWAGFAQEAIDADTAYKSIPKEERQLVADAIQIAVLAGGTGLYKNEHTIVNSLTGESKIINAQAEVFYDVFGNPEYLTGTARDVTQERELQQHLESQIKERTEKLQYANAELAEANDSLQKSNSELGQFAYIASHDLQEPVRKISTFIKMLEENLGNSIDDRSKFYIQRIENSTQRMTSLIRDILGYSQLSKDSDIFAITDLNDIANGVITDFELIIEQKNATVTISDMPVIEAIPLQMTQLFGNLISNSLKYSNENIAPVITVKASLVTESEKEQYHLTAGIDYYKIDFKDNGIGFKQDYAQQIFNIFQRLHSKNEYYGTGIGLAMCKKIAQNHNGDILAFSGEGVGAQFTVLLPVMHLT
jgi:PAS domain S-box-containing protein